MQPGLAPTVPIISAFPACDATSVSKAITTLNARDTRSLKGFNNQ